ncbi:DUF4132 domain-containing protein [Bernardetia sp.]|uniref:DUF4132 domain-containing protein n=1 Tax=Bernardetia sp. TaxID=1937974 RepID=UPI0025BDEACA|nr:DUF4132 domain-containing protein [Bernardetia sp.]
MINKDDVWGNAVTEFFDYAEEKQQLLWSYLFEKIAEVTPRSYKKQILPILEKIGEKQFRKVVHDWLELVILTPPKTVFYEDESGLEYERNYILEYPNETIFARLMRALPFVADQNSIDLLSELAIEAGRNRNDKITGIAAYKLSEQAIYALADIETVSPVSALLSVQIKLQSLSLKKLIEKKLAQIAKKQKLELIELLENHLPNYGLENGFAEGEIQSKVNPNKIYAYQMQVVENKVKLTWFDINGKELKSVPAALKREFPQKIEKLKNTATEAQKTLTLQRERLEKTYLTQKTFTYSHWKNAYANHGLLGTVVENLIWQVQTNKKEWKTVWSSFGRFVDADKNPVEAKKDDLIRVLHPVFLDDEELKYWQDFIKQKNLKQPFQQIFRPIFERTEEEQEESRRFEGIILNQKKLRTFAKIQGWNYKWLSFPKMNRSFVTFQFDYKLALTEKPQKLEIELWVEAIQSHPQNVKTSVVRLHKKAQALSFEILDKVTFSELFRMIQRIINVASVE